ncbi:hypothetical protein TrRE_jg10507, partial [Triparma retinervis]
MSTFAASSGVNGYDVTASDTQETKIAVIGSTGVGKSTLINALGGLKKDFNTPYPSGRPRPPPFKRGAGARGVTTKSSAVKIEFDDLHQVTIIDTPGLNDPDGNDSKNIAEMVDTLKREKYVNAFVVVMNGQAPRIDKPTQDMLTIFSMCFGVEFMSNIIFVYTRWRQDDEGKQERRDDVADHNSEEETHYLDLEDMRRTEIRAQLSVDFNFRGRDRPFIFIDSMDGLRDDVSAERKEIFQRNADAMSTISRHMQPFSCLDIQAVQTLLEQKEEALLELQHANDAMAVKHAAERRAARKEQEMLIENMEKMRAEHGEQLDGVQQELEEQRKQYDLATLKADQAQDDIKELKNQIKKVEDEAEKAKKEQELRLKEAEKRIEEQKAAAAANECKKNNSDLMAQLGPIFSLLGRGG